MDIVVEKSALIPFWEDVEANYDPNKEQIREQIYRQEQLLAKMREKRKRAKT